MHPHLKRPGLLLEQIRACRKRGIRVPVYTTVRWDERILREKPEWLCRDAEGRPVNRGSMQEPHFCYDICLNSGYREFFKNHIMDIIDVAGSENLDGLFMDIVMQTECCCESCRRLMKEEGLEEGIEKGRKEGLEEGIQIFIEDNLEEEVPEERIRSKLQKRFGLTEEKAAEYYERFAVQRKR